MGLGKGLEFRACFGGFLWILVVHWYPPHPPYFFFWGGGGGSVAHITWC